MQVNNNLACIGKCDETRKNTRRASVSESDFDEGRGNELTLHFTYINNNKRGI